MLIRLNKFLSESGICSRRQADEYILAGKISINGIFNKELGVKIDPEKDEIEFDGRAIKQTQNLVYYALNKPKGVVTTSSDEKGRKTVLDLIPVSTRVFPVGRLDQYSEGLIILTNDGGLTQNLTHPSFKHEKEYLVEANSRSLNAESASKIKKQFKSGLFIDGKRMSADAVEVDYLGGTSSSSFRLKLILHTGYNRQIRRMCDKIGLNVSKLVRIRIGKLRLDELGLKPGEYKEIKPESII